MKKVIALTVIAVMVIGIAGIALAQTDVEVPNWFKEMINWKKDRIDQAVKDGLITKEQADYYKNRLEYMEKYHQENGFNFGTGFGGCMGGFGFRGGFGSKGGFGPRGFSGTSFSPMRF
jgi:uncharacterized membrane protein YgcG